MKRILNFSILSSALLLLLVVGTGCLKDKYVDDNLAGPLINTSPKLVELMGAVAGTSSYQSSRVVAFDISTTVDTMELVSVKLAANEPADKDIQVVLELVPDLIQGYNDSNGTHFEPLPTNIYTFSSTDLTVTIPRGEREGKLNIMLVPEDLLGGEYALAFKIKSVSDPNIKISGNFNNVFTVIAVKNIYDGEYQVTGTLIDNVNPALGGLYPMTVHLITTGPNSVAMYDPIGFHDYIHPISNNGNFSGYGSYAPVFNFDPSGNGTVTSVVNFYGQPAGNGRSAMIDPAGINKWDPATKEMKVKYFLLQPGTTVRSTIDETFRYVGPR